MSRVLIAHPNYSDVGLLYSPVLSGGSWETDMGLANLQDSRLSVFARSQDALVTSTLFDADLGAARAIRLLALWKHNLSSAGTVRARGFSALPCFDSLTYGDAAWTAAGTPTRTPAAFVCSDGVPLDLVADDDGAVGEFWNRDVVFTGNGQKVLRIRVKKGTIIPVGGWEITVQDATAPANRLDITMDWTGAVPFAASSSTGSLVSVTAIGDGSYVLVFLTTSVTAANSHNIDIRPAAVAAQQGNLYVGDIVAFNQSTDQVVYDSGYQAGYPSGQTVETLEGQNIGWRHVTPSAQSARYWRVNIADTANADGYVQAAQLWIAGGFQPTVNMADGARLTPMTESTKEYSDGGAAIPNRKPVRRRLDFVLQDLPEAELLDNGFQMQRIVGTTRPVFVVYEPDDTTLMHHRAFPATLHELSALEFPYASRASLPFSLIEHL